MGLRFQTGNIRDTWCCTPLSLQTAMAGLRLRSMSPAHRLFLLDRVLVLRETNAMKRGTHHVEGSPEEVGKTEEVLDDLISCEHKQYGSGS
jgi:hypothetical protein